MSRSSAVLGCLLALLGSRPARAGSARIVVDASALSDSARPVLAPLRRHAAVEVISASEPDPPQREAVLAAAKRSYGSMSFHRAVAELVAQEGQLVEGARPSPQRVARLAEVELFLGACMLLDQDPRGAEERFALARALLPNIAVDPIFPPEVARALATTRPGPAIPVELVLSPEDARLWIDGAPIAGRARLSAGLHYVVLERADRRPAARIVRVGKSSPRIELSAAAPASTDAALAALKDAAIRKSDALQVSRLLGAPLWRISTQGGGLLAERWSAADPTRPEITLHLGAADGAALERDVCAIDACEPLTAEPPRPAEPVWRKAWFWGVIGTTAALVVGGVVAGAIVGTRPRDYEAMVR